MQESTIREQVLKKVRAALISKTRDPFPGHDYEPTVFEVENDIPEIVFAKNLKDAGGNFIFCSDEEIGRAHV